jgi:P4 family phage/plasmid primase-like protien
VPLPPATFERLERELRAAGVSVGGNSKRSMVNFVPRGQRDTDMVSHAGVLARAVTRGERTLPEALGEIRFWVKNSVEQTPGDLLSEEKAVSKVIEFIKRDLDPPRNYKLPAGWDRGLSEEDKQRLDLDSSSDHEQWSAERFLIEIKRAAEEFPDRSTPALDEKVDLFLKRLAMSGGSVSTLNVERILVDIKKLMGNGVSLATLKKTLAAHQKGSINGDNHDEIADAAVEFFERTGALRHHGGRFHQWRHTHWVPVSEDEIKQVISSEFGNLEVSRRNSDYDGILRLMRTKCAKPLAQSARPGMNFLNGYLDEKISLIPHDPDHGATYVLPYNYLPAAVGEMPKFQKFLTDSWGHDADFPKKVALLQEMMGATFFRAATPYQSAYLLYGVARSGKSVASQLMRGLLPETAYCSLAPQEWGERFSPAKMEGKLMNFAGELSETRSIPGDMFKLIVEGELIQAEQKYGDPFEYRPVAAQWFNSNVLPRTKDTTKGFTRRWTILEWNRSVPADRVNPDLAKEILETEREAIAAWAVEGYRRLTVQRRYTLPESHLRLQKALLQKLNPVARYLHTSDNLIVGRAAVAATRRPPASLQELWGHYRASWQQGLPNLSLPDFMARMRDLEDDLDFHVDEDAGLVEGVALKK